MKAEITLAVPGCAPAVVDALARLQLAARRSGGAITLRRADPELRALLDFVGLRDVLPSGDGLEQTDE